MKEIFFGLIKNKVVISLITALFFVFSFLAIWSKTGEATTISNLIGYWDFDDIPGREALDQSGNDFHAYVATALPNVVGKKNYSLLFGGVRSYAAIDHHELLDFNANESFSISTWIKMKDNINPWRVIVGKANKDSLNGYMLRHNQGGNLAMMIDDGNGMQSNAVAQQDYRDGKWHHVVGVINRFNDTNVIYVDGYRLGEDSIKGFGSLTNSYSLNIGALQNGAVSFYGLIDEVRMYDKALSSAEIRQLYNQDCDCRGFTSDPPVKIYPAGSLLQAIGNNDIYYINKKNQKKLIINPFVFDLYNNEWQDVIKVYPQDLDQYKTVNLIRGINDYKIYLIDRTRKIWIKTPEEFNNFGFKLEDIDIVRDEEVFEYHD